MRGERGANMAKQTSTSEAERVKVLRASLKKMGDEQLTWTLGTLLCIPTPRQTFVRFSISIVEDEMDSRGLHKG